MKLGGNIVKVTIIKGPHFEECEKKAYAILFKHLAKEFSEDAERLSDLHPIEKCVLIKKTS
jgi:hypothetical protein